MNEAPHIAVKNPKQKKAKARKSQTGLPSVSVITPAYNEAEILAENLRTLSSYLEGLESLYDWELVVVNDGSKDDTGTIADEVAKRKPRIRVLHHRTNRNLGGALQTGFQAARGEYIVVMDIDLTYSVDHIGTMLERIVGTGVDVVVASPYMKGGKNTSVPLFRLLLSRIVNWMLRFMSPYKLHTFTGMVRAYRADFIKTLNLKSITYSINPEIIKKGIILRANMEEIPAHLDWSNQANNGRTSSIRVYRGILAGLMSGFIFRPYMFFMSIGLVLFSISFYVIGWIFWHTFQVYPDLPASISGFEDRFSAAVGQVFMDRAYAFLVGGISLIIAFQFLGIGFLSLQNKRYFDELFHINSTVLKGQHQHNK